VLSPTTGWKESRKVKALKQIGIIIVTYQSERHIGPLLHSLAATIDPERTVIWVFDNASPDTTLSVFERESKDLGLSLHLIKSESNLGFTQANNKALEAMQVETPCETIILLNPDTVVHEGWWQPLLAELEKPNVGTATPLLLLPDGTVNARGNALHFLGLGFVKGYGEQPDAQHSDETALFFGSGATLAFHMSTLNAMNAKLGLTGLFREDLFLYAEDTDFGWQMRLVGLEPRLVLNSRVTHDHRFWIQGPKLGEERLFWLERNRYLLLISNFKWPTLILLLPWILGSELALGLGVWKLYPHRLKLWRAIITQLQSPAFWSRRRGLQAGRTARDRDILHAMTGSIQHGARPFGTMDRILNGFLRGSHGLLCAIVWW
jgi:GT2 family glycosyltransferase